MPERMSKSREDKRALVSELNVGCGWDLKEGNVHTYVPLFHSAPQVAGDCPWALSDVG